MDRRGSAQYRYVSPRSSSVRPDLGSLFDEHFAYVWSSLARLGVRPSDLEDVAHDVFPVSYTHLTLPTNREV